MCSIGFFDYIYKYNRTLCTIVQVAVARRFINSALMNLRAYLKGATLIEERHSYWKVLRLLKGARVMIAHGCLTG